MKTSKSLLSVLLLTGTLGLSSAPVWGEGVTLKVAANPQSGYCHMKFPAIREETLSSARPVLKDAGTGDIIDFYGSCDHNPLGKEEVDAQRIQLENLYQNESD